MSANQVVNRKNSNWTADTFLATKCRRGITLIEVTLAMFLGTFLLLVIFQSFFLAARYRMSAGESHHFGLSLTSSLRDLSSDLVSHHPKLKVQEEPKDFNSVTRSLKQSSQLKQLLGFQDSFASSSNESWAAFVGHPKYCLFQASTTHPRFNYLPEVALRSGQSLIVWWCSKGQSLSVEGWLNEDLVVSKTISNPLHKKGLMRTQFYLDQFGVDQQVSELMNPDVTEIDFQYFNGESLVQNWPIVEVNDSPVAVIIKIKVMGREIEHWIRIPASSRKLK